MSSPSDLSEINFDNLNAFTGNNADFAKQLILAFLSELENFSQHIYSQPSEAEFLAFRKAHHSISPSLQMLGLEAFNTLIGNYKSSYTEHPESLPQHAEQIEKTAEALKERIRLWLSAL
jgi:HPt (histidine-containing phosphotransfer) domain-containing protein